MENIVNAVNNVVWSNWLVYLCLGAGIYFSLRTKFSQIRNLKEMVHLLFAGEKSEEGISSFQGFCTALAGRIGTGNIAGVATAIAWGGPGALFWMWAIAFLGAGSAFAESTLGQLYKEKHDGQYCGGPAYYIEKGFGKKGWAKAYGMLFAIVTVISIGVLLPGVQSNSIAAAVNNAFGVNVTITGVALVILVGVVIFGGIKRIGSAAEFIVPFMGGAYILMAVIIIIVNIGYLPHVIALIFKSAFRAEPTFAGIIGSTIAWGVKRGVYSNEAGQGTGPQASSAAEVSHPAKQGFVQAFSVYVDTLFVCSATGFMILMTDNYTTFNADGSVLYNAGTAYTVDQIGPAYTQGAVNTLINGFGAAFVAIALFFFAFTTLMAYYYIAEVNVNYIIKRLTGKGNVMATHVLKVVLLGMTFYGAVKTSDLAWAMGDIGVGLMAWLNIIAILALSNIAMKCFKDYERQLKEGKASEDITFDPVSLGIKNADFWENLNAGKVE
ncbi:MAG: alanine/glycine:cation symporter family protein [Terrisporobacter sp.]|uniref:alanine/glycine:cation symporter family protein n=1 Tax=Terrisporobacter sp. TaxID=1965305 RepID=UPI002A90DF30|nr:alanine/glycine:cation symporter family protein [Terrisporobacter sp.]MCI5628938.1 alanine:cation symporter family protein [Clostridium sp.]MCI6459311.1 alanine:cation symporter family protein [Clostridium sp.]MCI7205733.1 alanine:cation symporter family protein [Clostridium sp.]MDY6153997.1 alanine/glycine:cation symporter family protein [Terrisporobacter sp.]